MDPNATLDAIASELLDTHRGIADGERLDELCSDLADWIDNGGFLPTNATEHTSTGLPEGSAWEYFQLRRRMARYHRGL